MPVTRLSVAPLPLLNWTWLPCPTEKLDQLTMPVALDCVTVRLVGEFAPIETLPLTTVPPDGSDWAIDGWAKPKPHKSARELTEVQKFQVQDSTAAERQDVDEMIIEPPSA